jgi:polyferredoxin
MQSYQTKAYTDGLEKPTILKPDPQWFLKRIVFWGILFPVLLIALGSRKLGLLCPFGLFLVWLAFRNSYISLDSQGFHYHSIARKISHKWIEIERFGVVEQKMLHFITFARYLGWNFSPAYKNYKLLAIPRALASFAGVTHAMFMPIGFDVPTLAATMNQHLQRSRAAHNQMPSSVATYDF